MHHGFGRKLRACDYLNASAQMDCHALALEPTPYGICQRLVPVWQDALASFNDRHLGAHLSECRSKLQADVARADHEQPSGHPVQR